MRTLFYKSTLTVVLAAGLFTSCVNDDDYETPVLECIETTLTKTMEPQQVPATAVAAPFSGPANSVIEAYVVSSDLGGNFFKTISFQTLDGSFGFSVPVDVTSTFTKFDTGRKVLIKLDGTYTDIKYGSMRIGALFGNEVGRLSADDYEKVLNRSCTRVDEDILAKPRTIAETLSDSKINTLIDLQNVQFRADATGKTYYDDTNQIGGATNYYLVDQAGNQIIFRTSSFATFAGSTVPNGSGTVRGVLTKFNTDYQFMARTEEDVKLNNPRFTNGGNEPESEFALGGTEIAFTGALNEDFEGYAVTTNTFPEYVNDHGVGNRYWQVKEFQDNKYIEMSSYNGANPGVTAKSYFFVPVDFSAANTFTFSKEIRYMKGQALKVYYVTSENYTAGGLFNTSNFVDITGGFSNLIYPAMDGSQNFFTTAGIYNIPASLAGTGFFVFEYTGNSTITTTIQIDDIIIN